MEISDVAYICDITSSVVSGYELNRYYPSKEILDKLSSTFNIDYLCSDGYTHLILNYNVFLRNLKTFIKDNKFLRKDVASKLAVSPGTIKYWFDGGIITINLYNKIRYNLYHYKLI